MAARRQGPAAGHRPRPVGHRDSTTLQGVGGDAVPRDRTRPAGIGAGVLRLHELLRRHRRRAECDEPPQLVAVPEGLGRGRGRARPRTRSAPAAPPARPAAGRGDVPVLTVGAIGRGAGRRDPQRRPGDRQPRPRRCRRGRCWSGTTRPAPRWPRAALADEVLDETGLHSYAGSVPRGASSASRSSTRRHRLAVRAQSAHAPTVSLTARRTARPSVARRWSASPGRARTRTATALGDRRGLGRRRPTWRRVYQGAARPRVLPRYFAASANARIRVTVNDGFRSTAAVVRPLPHARRAGHRAHRQPAHRARSSTRTARCR